MFILLSATKSHWAILFTNVFRDRMWRLTRGEEESWFWESGMSGSPRNVEVDRRAICVSVQATQSQHSQSHGKWHSLQWALRMKPGLEGSRLSWLPSSMGSTCSTGVQPTSDFHLHSSWPLWVSHHGASFQREEQPDFQAFWVFMVYLTYCATSLEWVNWSDFLESFLKRKLWI